MNTCTIKNVGESDTAVASEARATSKSAVEHKPREAIRSKSKGAGKPAAKSKKDQLVTLLSKPNGARISVIVERLGWQAHTVRAALSGLRKQGIKVSASKSPKTGETVYAIVAPSNGKDGPSGNGAAS